jgi:nitric oxide dioxygenase
MNLNAVQTQLPLDNGDFYVCGPANFMAFVKKQLLELGVKNESIHYEVFGPHQDL